MDVFTAGVIVALLVGLLLAALSLVMIFFFSRGSGN